MKKLTNLVKKETLNVEELMRIKGASAPIDHPCTTTQCNKNGCTSGVCGSASCNAYSCNLAACSANVESRILLGENGSSNY
jgi:hypothetical protein